MRIDELNAHERRLWDAFSQGRRLDVSDDPAAPDPVIRSDVVAALLLGAHAEPAPGDRPALRLTGAHITGRLDLGFTDVAAPIHLTDCRFDEAPLLQGARTRQLVLTDCTLPGLVADTAQIDGRLVVTHCRLTGPLVLNRAQINGDLDLRETAIGFPAGEAVSANHAHVGGDALCANLAVEGTFRLSGASIDGEFDLEGASLRAPGRHALDAYHVRVAEDFTFHPGFSAEGRIILSGAAVAAAIGFCGARLSNPGDTALEAVGHRRSAPSSWPVRTAPSALLGPRHLDRAFVMLDHHLREGGVERLARGVLQLGHLLARHHAAHVVRGVVHGTLGGHVLAPGGQPAGERPDLRVLGLLDAGGELLHLGRPRTVGREVGHLDGLAVVGDHPRREGDVGSVVLPLRCRCRCRRGRRGGRGGGGGVAAVSGRAVVVAVATAGGQDECCRTCGSHGGGTADEGTLADHGGATP
ncbi:hypothetical protein STENM327S_05596 [Streptomyces tendae]